MPLYRFLIHADDLIDDPEGLTFPDDAAALAEAVKIVRELKQDCRQSGCVGLAVQITQDGRQLAWIPFESVE
jgi:hypothetical protein